MGASTSTSQPLRDHCVYYHSDIEQGGADYPWLTPYYGRLVKAEFNELGRGWTNYAELHQSTSDSHVHNWWVEHCQAVNHEIGSIYNSHIATFVDPETRTIILRYTFEGGMTYRSDIDLDVFVHFYQLEEEYAKMLSDRQK